MVWLHLPRNRYGTFKSSCGWKERIEGGRNKRYELDKAPTSPQKVAKKTANHVLAPLAAGNGFDLRCYFYPIRELVVRSFYTARPMAGLNFWVAFFTIATYLNAGWMREQVCLYYVPYARFQPSLCFDPNTRIVSYDLNSWFEPRGRRRKEVNPMKFGLATAIDCGQCVQVCPTGKSTS